MKKLTVLISGYSKLVSLQESILVTNDSYLFVKKATIFWNYYNITDKNSGWTHSSNSYKLSPGYYTFKLIKKEIEKLSNVTINPTVFDGKCIVSNQSSSNLVLTNDIKALLGFNSGTIGSNRTVKSDSQVDINNGLRYIKIHCSVVDNACVINENGKKDTTICSLPITSKQTLLGSVQHFYDIESKVSLDKGVINQLEFNITDQDGKVINVGSVLLECYIV